MLASSNFISEDGGTAQRISLVFRRLSLCCSALMRCFIYPSATTSCKQQFKTCHEFTKGSDVFDPILGSLRRNWTGKQGNTAMQ